MKIVTILAAALSLAFLAACDRHAAQPKISAPASGSSAAPAGPRNEPAPSTQTTPSNAGTPSQSGRAESDKPQSEHVDPKDPAQRKDFERSGK